MRASALSLSWAPSVAIVLAGCASPPDISGELEDYGSLLNAVVSAQCACYLDLGYDDVTSCIDGLGQVTLSDRECLADVAEGYEEDVQSRLSCVNPALERYVECLELNDACAEGTHDECASTYNSQVAGCSALPAEIQGSFLACTE